MLNRDSSTKDLAEAEKTANSMRKQRKTQKSTREAGLSIS